MNILEFAKMIAPKRTIIKEPNSGEKWIKRDINPFKESSVKILEVKDNYVQYKFLNSGVIKSCTVKQFITVYCIYND